MDEVEFHLGAYDQRRENCGDKQQKVQPVSRFGSGNKICFRGKILGRGSGKWGTKFRHEDLAALLVVRRIQSENVLLNQVETRLANAKAQT
jgi:hypothetical protein